MSLRLGYNIYLHGMSATPKAAITKLCEMVKQGKMQKLGTVHQIIDGDAEYGRPEFANTIRANNLFVGVSLRKSVDEGL